MMSGISCGVFSSILKHVHRILSVSATITDPLKNNGKRVRANRQKKARVNLEVVTNVTLSDVNARIDVAHQLIHVRGLCSVWRFFFLLIQMQ